MIEKKLLPDISPETTSLYMYEDIVSIKMGSTVTKRERVLLDTCQWLYEVVDRMEDGDAYLFSILTNEQLDDYMRNHQGFTDEDFARIKESSAEIKRRIDEMLFKTNNNDDPKK